ncbi:3,4-dihydroxy-2-butanone-4-phosphate synthase, partial [Arthrobacter sp. 35/47]|uniref:3,4-dihydroxy-2-butanone-4-phosphate synthase n=1 Tax=Arthrobacter sp. 35/47 TaxID=269454 RepID=UPI00047AF46C
EAMAAGRAVVVVDDANRENEGDIIFAAQFATAELTGWTIRYTSGVLCVPVTGETADRLALPAMVLNNQDSKQTAYTVSCDAAVGVSTGISAADRALTARVLASASSTPSDLTRPGHMFPLRAVDGGVRERRGHTEAAIDLCRDANRENEGDIIFAAQFATAELTGWTIRYTSGVLCVPVTGETADRLALPAMVLNNQDSKQTAYTVSCDAAVGVSTGISAADRALTARVLASASSTPSDLTRPGHMFPLRAVDGGVR